MALKENYKDDILDVSVNTKRKYRMTENADGTISLDDETVYTQEGDSFGATDLNAMAHAINNTSSDAEHTSYDNTTSGLISDNVQGAIDEINDNLKQTPIDMGGGVVLSTLDEKINYMLNGSPIKVGVAVQENYANISSDRTYDISKYSNIKLCVWGRSGSNNKSTAIKIDGQTVKTISDAGGATTLEVGVTENNVLSIGPSSSGGSVLVTYMLLGFYDNNMVETINAPT